MKESLKNQINFKRYQIKRHDGEGNRVSYKKKNNIKFTNLWVFGSPGTGKSKLINSIYKSLHDNYDSETLARSASGENHVTQSLSFVDMSARNALPTERMNFKIVDCWGDAGSNYSGRFVPILQGQLPIGYKMNQDLPYHTTSNEKNRVHCVIFAITALNCGEPTQTEALKKYYDIAVQNRLRPIVVITKIDTNDKDIKFTPDEDYESRKSVEDSIKSLIDAVGVERDDVFCVKNFVDPEDKRNPVLTLKFLKILDRALDNAQLHFDHLKLECNTADTNEDDDEEIFYVKACYVGDRENL
jgi:hypothetical protein